eukprot:gene11698-15662_t
MIKTHRNRRVVITGVGVLCPLGYELEHIWKSLLEGGCGLSHINDHHTIQQGIPIQIAGFVPKEVYSYDINNNPSLSKATRLSDREISKFIRFAIIASDLAIKQANINICENQMENIHSVSPLRSGAAIGTGGIGSLYDIIESNNSLNNSYKKLSPFFVPKVLVNMAAGHVSIRHNLKGPVHAVATACAAGSHSIGDAYNFIRLGYADLMLAGGTESCIEDDLAIAGFARMKALSTNDNPLTASKPFDKHRNGFVISEGAAVLVLEELDTAVKRNANIIAEIVGYGLSGDAFHATSPALDGEGAQRSMIMAIHDAGISPHDIGYINAHATSTPLGDKIELNAINEVFKDRKINDNKNYSKLFVSSTKGATGHLLGAAGAMEIVFTALALKTGKIPPTINLNNPESRDNNMEDVFHHVPNKSIDYYNDINHPYHLKYALKNSFGFGGVNCSLVLKKYDA